MLLVKISVLGHPNLACRKILATPILLPQVREILEGSIVGERRQAPVSQGRCKKSLASRHMEAWSSCMICGDYSAVEVNQSRVATRFSLPVPAAAHAAHDGSTVKTNFTT